MVWDINGALWIEVPYENICKPENQTALSWYSAVRFIFYIAVQHDAVDQLSDGYASVNRIRKHFSLWYITSSRHVSSLLA